MNPSGPFQFDFSKADEAALRDVEAPTPDSAKALLDLVNTLVEREHDYGTCVSAMSIAATAAFNYVARKLGVTGFQAGCADLDILRRTRRMTCGFSILDMEKLLYPQYRDNFVVTPESLLANPRTRAVIRSRATKLLQTRPDSHPDVVRHWKTLSELPVLKDEPAIA